MLPAKLTRDEHGSILDRNLPSFVVTDEDYERWRVCVEAAVKIAEAEETSHEVRMFATEIYRMPNPTHEPEPMDAEEAQLEEGRFRDWLAWLHPRGRGGRFIDTPDAPRPNAPTITPTALKRKRTPGVTLEEIEAAGLNKWPEPGEAARRILGNLRSTAELYALPQNPASPGAEDSILEQRNVPYVPEREALHQQIIESYLAGKTSPAGSPHAVFTAGGPASGKSTLLGDNPHLLPPPENTVHIDVDELKELLPEYNEMRGAGDRYAALAVHRESGDIAAKLSDRARAQGLNVIMDGTGDGELGQFSHDLALMRDSGYTVDLVYVDIPTDVAVARAVERAEEKGRFVPIPVVRQQHRAVSRNFRDEIVGLDFLNSLIVLDNENRLAELKGGEVEILDAEGYSRFLDKADEGN